MTNPTRRPPEASARFGGGAWLGRLKCACAAFPHAAYEQLKTPSTLAQVGARGLAGVLSPLAFTLAFLSNGQRFIGHSVYLYLLPVAVFAVDRLLIANSYVPGRRSGWLLAIRYSVFLLSGFMALFAGVVSESENLLRGLYQAEDGITRQGLPYRNLAARLETVDAQVAANDKELAGRNGAESERLKYRALQQRECEGLAGIDPATGVVIRGGGRCGDWAKDHRITAEAAEARLAHLARLAAENRELESRRAELAEAQEALLRSGRSPSDSLGSLLRALGGGDLSLWIKVGVLFLAVTLTEGLAFAVSEMPVPETLRAAVAASDAIDQVRLRTWHDAGLAKAMRERAALRAQAADELAPLDVKLSAAPNYETGRPAAAEPEPEREPAPRRRPAAGSSGES